MRQAVKCERLHKEVVTKRAYELTGLENPNSVAQLKGWLGENGMEAESLSKKAVAELIKGADGEVEELLRLRLLMAKTSVKKYEAMERSVCSDGRVHGLLQFYGANRTGRWAGRLVQVQNLPQNHLPDLELARKLVKEGRFEDVEMFYGSTPEVLSELIRTGLCRRRGAGLWWRIFLRLRRGCWRGLRRSGGGWRCFLPTGRFMRLLRRLCSMFRLRK